MLFIDSTHFFWVNMSRLTPGRERPKTMQRRNTGFAATSKGGWPS